MLAALGAAAAVAGVLALATLACTLIGLADADTAAVSIFAGLTLGLVFFSLSVRIAFAKRPLRATRSVSFRVLALLWLAVPIIASAPFLQLTDVTFPQAVFEAASAFTTTGGTIYTSLEDVPRSIIGWRAILQWLGGLATLASIIVVLAPSGAGGTPLLRFGGDMEQIFRTRLSSIIGVYSAMTLACFVLIFAAGIPAFEAFALSLSTLSTGGMMPTDGTLSDYQTPLAEWIIGVFVLIGATSLLWYRMVATGRLGRSITLVESASVFAVAALLSLAYAVAFARAAGSEEVLSIIDAAREGFVTATSLISTTGFEARNAGAAALPLALILVILLVGGGMFSTAGGLKFYRLALMTRHSVKELERVLYPHSISTDQFGRFSYDTEAMRAVWTTLVLFVSAWAVSALVLASTGLPAPAALVAALSNLSNIGQAYTFGWVEFGVWPAYAEMSPAATHALVFTMIIGRLEIIGLIAGFGYQILRK